MKRTRADIILKVMDLGLELKPEDKEYIEGYFDGIKSEWEKEHPGQKYEDQFLVKNVKQDPMEF